MKMLTFFAFTSLISCLIMLLAPICRTWKQIKPVNAKKSQNFHFLNPRIVFSAFILGKWENQPLPSDLKPPLDNSFVWWFRSYQKETCVAQVLERDRIEFDRNGTTLSFGEDNYFTSFILHGHNFWYKQAKSLIEIEQYTIIHNFSPKKNSKKN